MASEVAKRLRDRRQNVWNEAKAIAETAATENRALTDEEQGKWDAMQEEMSKLDTRIRAVLDTEKRAKEADDAFDALSGRKPDQGQAVRTAGGGKMLEELRKWARGDEGAGRALEIRRDPALGPINYRILTTAGQNSGTNASSIIPTDFYDMLIAHLIEVSGIMQCGPTVLNTGGGETLQVPKTTAHSTAASAAQAGSLPTSDPAFSMQPLSAYKYGVLLQVARELIDDSAVDLLGYLAMQAGRALGNAFGNDLVNGAGTGNPTGLVTVATTGVTGTVTGVSGAPSYANLVDMEYSVIAPVSPEAATGSRPIKQSDPSGKLPIPSAGRSGSRPRSSGPLTCCSASPWSPIRSCRSSPPAPRRSPSGTSASSSCGWSAGSGSSDPTILLSEVTWSPSGQFSAAMVPS
jgi:HK97 family phage major capsid protein